MRREYREVADFQEIIEIIKNCEVCHVAFHTDDYPYVVAMNFGMSVEEKRSYYISMVPSLEKCIL